MCPMRRVLGERDSHIQQKCRLICRQDCATNSYRPLNSDTTLDIRLSLLSSLSFHDVGAEISFGESMATLIYGAIIVMHITNVLRSVYKYAARSVDQPASLDGQGNGYVSIYCNHCSACTMRCIFSNC